MPNESPKYSRRKIWLILLLVLVPTLLFLGWSQASLNLSFLQPSSSAETILLWALAALIVVAFIIFALILIRILLKLYVERRQRKLGSKFKTKMVVAFLALSLVPVCFLFVFAYGLLNRTMDKWFGIPFDTVRRDATEIVKQLRLQSEERTILDAIQIADNPELAETLKAQDPGKIASVLMNQASDLGLVAALCFDRNGKLLARAGEPKPDPDEILQVFSSQTTQAGANVPVLAGLRELDSTTLAGARPVALDGETLGSVVAVTRLPIIITKVAEEIQQEAARYDELSRHQKALKRNALSILGLLTLLILFAATWLALFLSKQVTVPIQALAEGTHEVSSGNLGFQITARADDELGSLIASFNEMTRQLLESRRTIEKAANDLQNANRELEERGHTTQTILENISVGVASFDPQGQITQVNSTLERMLDPQRVKEARKLADLFAPDEAREIARLFRRASRQGVVTRQTELELASRRTVVTVTVSSIRARHGTVGFVMVIDDITDILQAQKASAWGEVAQRVAHEIKNPLTPIQLSAERIQRIAARDGNAAGNGEFITTILESARLIDREVATLKMLVDEFSRFARFPVSQPVPCSLNAVVAEALEVFGGRLEGVAIHCNLAPALPVVQADPEQMKRVVVNLVDNAAEALEQSALKEVWVQTNLDSEREVVELIVADSGPGISPEAKERLFFPHFSTKRRGTGLGLAIVSRIVTEHKGTIRAEENHPTGTKIIIELPLERAALLPDANARPEKSAA
jgi:two-component system, NtrC family, nitrogen regulation sensor histidine kinase NtrY